MVGPEGLQEASTLPKLRVVPLKIAEQGSTFPRGLAACKTLANKRPVASRRETASTQFNPSSETLFQLIQFQQKKCK